jgi:hypothetical protein
MEPPDDRNVTVIDLNNISPAVIDLTGPQRLPPRVHRSKGKRAASPTSNSPMSSKRGSKGEEIMVGLTNTFYQIRDQLQSTMIKSSTSSSVANAGLNIGEPRDWVVEAMTLINTLSADMALSTRAVRNACTALKTPHEAKIFVLMSEPVQRDWLMGFVSNDDD